MRHRGGYSLIEVLVVLGITVLVGLFFLPSLTGRRSGVALDLATREVAATLREAQSRAVIQASSSQWGVHFDNGTSSPFFALFAGAYGSSTTLERKLLPTGIRFASASIPLGSSTDVVFLEATGRPVATATIALEFTSGGTGGTVTSTSVIVTSVGTITF